MTSDCLLPWLSVVTVNRNNAAGLSRTIDSVSTQGRADIEYIIIDGGSTDASAMVLRERDAEIDYWITEHDAGIYDAMNKGAAIARGEFICFMNSGDVFAPNVLTRLFERRDEWRTCDVVYGDMVNAATGTIDRAQDASRILLDMPARHQAMMVRGKLQRQFRFDVSYGVAADYDLLLRLFFAGYRFLRVDLCFGAYEAGGVSNARYFRIINEYVRILWRRDHGARRAERVAKYLWAKKKFMAYLVTRRLLGETAYSAAIRRLKYVSLIQNRDDERGDE